MQCELLERCAFHHDVMRNRLSTLSIYRSVFCDTASEKCARKIVARQVGEEKVPPDLYPNHTIRLRDLINDIDAW